MKKEKTTYQNQTPSGASKTAGEKQTKKGNFFFLQQKQITDRNNK